MNRTATAALTAALTTGLLTAGAGTAHAYMVPAHNYAMVSHYDYAYPSTEQTATPPTIGGVRPLLWAEKSTCRAIILPQDSRPGYTVVERTVTDNNGYITVPVPSAFQGKRAVTVEVQVGTTTSALPKWMRSAKPWAGFPGSTTPKTVTTKKRFSAPLSGSISVGIPNGAVWPDIPLASASVRVSFATGSATRFALEGGRSATGKCRGYGKTLGAVEHHELLSVNLTQKTWEAGNRLTRIKVA
jgi:hypothetical protein